jgi:type II secretory pathway pseudopilin PulG
VTPTKVQEDGFTLIEILVAMIVATLLVSAVAAAIVAAVETTGSVSARLSQTNDRQLVEIYLPRDTASAQVAQDSVTNGGTQPPATCAKDQGVLGTPTAVLVLKGTSEIFTTTQGGPKITYDSYEADYVVANKIASEKTPELTSSLKSKTHVYGKRLVRYYCSTPHAYTSTNPNRTFLTCSVMGAACSNQVISFDLWSLETGAVQPVIATIKGTTTHAYRTIITLTLTDSTKNQYSMTGVERS